MIYLSRRTFYIKVKEMWLYERDSNAPSVSSEPGGKQCNTIYGVSVIDEKFGIGLGNSLANPLFISTNGETIQY